MSRLEEALEEFKDEIISRGCTSEDLFLVLNIDGIDDYRGIPCDVFLEEMKNLDVLSWQFEEP